MEELIEQSVVSAFNVKVFGEAISKTPTKSKVLTAEFGASTLTYVKVADLMTLLKLKCGKLEKTKYHQNCN
mgnify:CR=1 FL=1